MVDRIEKTDRASHWKIASTKETKEEKKREDKGQSGQQEPRDSFGETSDFIQLLAKDPRKYSSEKIAAAQISGFTFRGVSTHREKAIVEVDISMINGTLIKGAQIAVNRAQGMQFISRRPGEELVVDQIVKGTILAVAVPQVHRNDVPVAPKVSETPVLAPETGWKARGFNWSYLLGLSALLLAILLLIYIFMTAKSA